MMELYLEGTEPSEEQLIAAIRRATIAGALTPVLCGTAFKNKGVQPMLDAIVDYLPSPVDIPAVQGHAVGDESTVVERHPNPEEPFSALAFKIMSDQHLGKLTYIRVYSGTVESGIDWAGALGLIAGAAALTAAGGLIAALYALAMRPAPVLRAE